MTNKRFCIKCDKQLFCSHKEPEMSAEDITKLILSALLDKNPQIFYKFLSPDFRQRIGNIRKFSQFLSLNFPNLLSSSFLSIVNHFQQNDDCNGSITIEYTNNGKPQFITLHFQRIFNYLENKPIFDKSTREYLNLYWRITNMESSKVKGKNRFIIMSKF